MKAGLFAVAAAMASGVVADSHNHARHNHAAFHNARGLAGTAPAVADDNCTCDCSTVYYTTTGAPTRELIYLLISRHIHPHTPSYTLPLPRIGIGIAV
jgi:hypothetical protein